MPPINSRGIEVEFIPSRIPGAFQWYARIPGTPWQAGGKTREEAIGSLVYFHHSQLGIIILELKENNEETRRDSILGRTVDRRP